MDPWKILGVGQDATATQIKRAYRTAVLRVHPDRGGSSADFQMVHDAFIAMVASARRTMNQRRFSLDCSYRSVWDEGTHYNNGSDFSSFLASAIRELNEH